MPNVPLSPLIYAVDEPGSGAIGQAWYSGFIGQLFEITLPGEIPVSWNQNDKL